MQDKSNWTQNPNNTTTNKTHFKQDKDQTAKQINYKAILTRSVPLGNNGLEPIPWQNEYQNYHYLNLSV